MNPKPIKIGGAFTPFGPLYTLKNAKEDSDRLLWAHRMERERIAAWREYGYTVTSMLLLIGYVGLTASAIGI